MADSNGKDSGGDLKKGENPCSWNITVEGRALVTCEKLEGHTQLVYGVAFSHDGQLLASASGDETVKLWNLSSGNEQKLKGHTHSVYSVAFSHDGQLLASASCDRTVRLWNPVTGEELQKLEGHTDAVSSVVFSHDGQQLASASYDKTVRLWNPAAGHDMPFHPCKCYRPS
jgi:WD40 repeat protein